MQDSRLSFGSRLSRKERIMSTFEERIAKAVTDKLNDGTVEELVSDAVTKALKAVLKISSIGKVKERRL